MSLKMVLVRAKICECQMHALMCQRNENTVLLRSVNEIFTVHAQVCVMYNNGSHVESSDARCATLCSVIVDGSDDAHTHSRLEV